LDDELRAVGSDQSTESLAEPLIRSLRRAMDPDPERRDAELGGMIEACQRVAVALGSAAVEPAPASPAVNAPAPPPQLPVSTEPPASPTPEGPVDLEARDPAGVLFLGSVALLTVAVAAWALFWRR
jgi:hypothetical protein